MPTIHGRHPVDLDAAIESVRTGCPDVTLSVNSDDSGWSISWSADDWLAYTAGMDLQAQLVAAISLTLRPR